MYISPERDRGGWEGGGEGEEENSIGRKKEGEREGRRARGGGRKNGCSYTGNISQKNFAP